MKLQPIQMLIIYLVLMAVVGSVSWVWGTPVKFLFQILHFVLIYGSMYVVGFVICKLMKKPMPRWEDRVITSLILFLLFDSFQPFWMFPLVGVITELAQRLIRVPTGPVFNPAALGTLIVSFFYLLPSWWGTNFSPRIPITAEGLSASALITIPVAGFIAWKYKKLWIGGTAALVTCVLYVLLFQVSPVYVLFEGTLAFFFLVMAVEPKTSPIIRNEQIVFGVVIGVCLPILLKLGFLEAYAGSLLIANALLQLYRYVSRKKMMAKTRPVVLPPQQ